MSIDLQLLRQALLPEPQTDVHVLEDGVDGRGLTPAAVLFPLVGRDSGYQVLLTQRTAHLRDHPGQVSFPGGRVEEEDASPWHTALRESREEIGLDASRVNLLGYLPEYRTATGFRITPVVAEVFPPLLLHPDPFEVAEIFEVPLDYLLDPANYQLRAMHYRGALRRYHAVPYGDYFIWGATAGMIHSLVDRLFALASGASSNGE